MRPSAWQGRTTGVGGVQEETVMKRLCALMIGVTLGLSTCAARADTITDWNETSIEVIKVAGVAGNPSSRTLAMCTSR
jgi:hypothetical protein